jgi:transposase InsO family protein
MSLNAEAKVVRQRLSVLELSEALGNVSEACRQRGVSRTQFYEYKRRFQTQGVEGLLDLPPVHHSHPLTTAPKVAERIVALSLEHPAWGCDRLSDHLALEGTKVSGPTIQRILNDNELGTRYHRWLRLEQQHAEQALALTAEQVKFIEKQNPAFREKHVESSRPGELLCQDTFQVGHIKGVGKVYLHVVVDTYSSLAFGFLHTTKRPEAAVAVLHNDVLPFYQERDIPVAAVLTDNGREFCGTDSHPYELYLALNEVEHRRTKVRKPQTNGFVERFNRTVLDEFCRTAFRTKFYESVEQLQTDLDQWLHHYNFERPHQGYRNLGRRPIDTINQFLAQAAAAVEAGAIAGTEAADVRYDP